MSEEENKSPILVPKIFHNSDTKAPMSHCIDCDHDLTLGDRFYMVEKVFKRYPEMESVQVLFEYAICSVCYEKMKEGMSVESMFTLSNYMMNNTDLQGMQQRIDDFPNNPEKWMTHCMVKGTDVKELDEFQIGACCKGNELVTNFMPPFLIGGTAMEEITELLSKETKDEMDGFMDDHFGIPPELRKDLILI